MSESENDTLQYQRTKAFTCWRTPDSPAKFPLWISVGRLGHSVLSSDFITGYGPPQHEKKWGRGGAHGAQKKWHSGGVGAAVGLA
jgi:hypothetical protein